MQEILVTFTVLIIILGPFIVMRYLGRYLRKTKPPKFPARSISFGFIMIAVFLLTLLFQHSGHVLTFTSFSLRIFISVFLFCSYYLMLKQIRYTETLILLTVSVTLWIPTLWNLTSSMPGYYNPLSKYSFENNPASFLALIIGGSSCMWFPILYLLRKETKHNYGTKSGISK